MSRHLAEIEKSHRLIETDPRSPVKNSQPAGIGRLAGIDNLLVINNLGRNIEVCTTENNALQRLAVFADTVFPGEDDPSQFDLDMHAFFRSADGAFLIAINHYGLARFLPWPSNETHNLKPVFCLKWPGDCERVVLAGDTFISSSPAGYKVKDPPEPGLLISQPWQSVSTACNSAPLLPYSVRLPDWGMINYVAVDRRQSALLVASGNRVGVFELRLSKDKTVPGPMIFEAQMQFRVGWAQFSDTGQSAVIAGYHPASAEAEDWDKLAGGGFAVLNMSGHKTAAGDFAADLAWGNGSVPLVLQAGKLYGVDRSASLYCWDLLTGKEILVSKPSQNNDDSLGMAHFTECSGALFCGFNRGGYRLHRYG